MQDRVLNTRHPCHHLTVVGLRHGERMHLRIGAEVELVLHQVECELRTVKGSSAEFLYEWLPVALFPYRIGGLAHARRERWLVGSGDGGRHGFRHMMSPYVGVSQQVQRVTLSRSQLV